MDYETIIGLEVHVELSTKSKIFCACTTEFGGEPNTHVCPVCLGMPGSLPVLNKAVVDYAIKTGIALGCEVVFYNSFDRKNYCYPDLPKAYQISQLYSPICKNGFLDIQTDGDVKKIGVREIHMEEDAGKLVHDLWDDVTLIDYNRCGVPLLEIVSQPDFRNSQQVIAYLEKLRETLIYLGVSDCKMQEGSMRVDVNLSVRPTGSEKLGVRTEMKNMNSFKFIKRAVEVEAKRQIEVLKSGDKVIQQTRRWDPNKDASFAMRDKENAKDYRYFPEPDLLPIVIADDWVISSTVTLPELAWQKRERYISEYGLCQYDAEEITSYKEIAELFEQTVKICDKPKEIANMIMVEIMRLMSANGVLAENLNIEPQKLADLIELISNGKINRNIGKDIMAKIFSDNVDPLKYVEEHGLVIVNDDNLITETVKNVLQVNAQSLADFKAGKEKAFGFLVGQTMRILKGKADPQLVNKILHQELNKL